MATGFMLKTEALSSGAVNELGLKAEAEREGGDHTIVIGRILSFGACEPEGGEPPLDFGKRFGRFKDLQAKIKKAGP